MEQHTPVPLLEAMGVTITYGGGRGRSSRERRHVAIADVALKVSPGDIVCLVGSSGCGKTSLLKALGGFVPPRSGKILFKGSELRATTPAIVMIFQEHNLYPWLTVEGNIMFAPRMMKLPRQEQKQTVARLLPIIGLEDSAHKYPHQLSGGMRQRVAIARALAAKPEVLLLDEPFTALDVSLRRRMQTFIREVWRETHTTMIMVTHDIEEAILVGQQVVVMGQQPGKILDTIDTSSPLVKSRYSDEFRGLCRQLEVLVGESETLEPPESCCATEIDAVACLPSSAATPG